MSMYEARRRLRSMTTRFSLGRHGTSYQIRPWVPASNISFQSCNWLNQPVHGPYFTNDFAVSKASHN